jgi:hypothetical protein
VPAPDWAASIASWRDNHKIESTVRYLGIAVDDALTIAEQVDVRITGAKPTGFASSSSSFTCHFRTLLATRHRLYVLPTLRVEPACGIDFFWSHPARDVAHLLADVVAPGTGREASSWVRR